MKESIIFLILVFRSLSMNYPVLSSWNYGFGKAISLVFNDSETCRNVIQQLSLHPVVIDSVMKVKDTYNNIFTSDISSANSEAVVCIMPDKLSKDHKKLDEKIQYILSASSAQQIDGNKAIVQCFFCFQSGVDYYFKDDHTVIDVNVDMGSSAVVDPVSVVPKAKYLDIIKHRISEREGKSSASETPLSRTLKAAVDMTYIQWKLAGRLDEYQQMMNCVEDFCRQYEIESDSPQIINRASDLLTEYIICNVQINNLSLPLKKIPNEMQGSNAFIDRNNIYITCNLFEHIMHSLLNLESLNLKDLKRMLFESDIIIGNRQQDYTSRMLYKLEDGRAGFSEMICLNGKKLRPYDEPKKTLAELLNSV